MENNQKVQTGLGAASSLVSAIPVFGTIAGGILGLGSSLAGMFGKKKEQPKPAKNGVGDTVNMLGQSQQVAGGLNPMEQQAPVQIPGAVPAIAPQPTPLIPVQPQAQPQGAAAPQPQQLPYKQARDNYIMQALVRNQG